MNRDVKSGYRLTAENILKDQNVLRMSYTDITNYRMRFHRMSEKHAWSGEMQVYL